MTAEITRYGLFDTQVCVPDGFTDEEVVEFANAANPCGTMNGWMIRKQDDPALAGCDERTCCTERSGHVHIMLDA